MRLDIKKLVDKHFSNKSQFAKAIEIGYPAACKLYDGNVSKINFDTLEKICSVLHCTPNDVLIMDANSENKNNSETTTLESTYTIPNDLRELIIKQIRLEISSLMSDFLTDKNNDDNSK